MLSDIKAHSPHVGAPIKKDTLYTSVTTETTYDVEAISIEREYLYWTQSGQPVHDRRHGSIHKAFTEPFVNATPFQTYEDYSIKAAQGITTNNHYLFFTGRESGATAD